MIKINYGYYLVSYEFHNKAQRKQNVQNIRFLYICLACRLDI